MTTKTSWRNVGQKIRILRREHQLTIKQLANGCDLSPNAISLIERGKVAPTVATLCKVAHALGAPIGSFFQEICADEVVLTRTHYPPADSSTGLIRPLTQTLQTLTCAISPQSDPTVTGDLIHADFTKQRVDAGQATPPHSGPEVLVCLSGQIECEINGQRYQLNPSDSLSFNGNVLPRWRNRGAGPAVAVIFFPAESIPTLAGEED